MDSVRSGTRKLEAGRDAAQNSIKQETACKTASVGGWVVCCHAAMRQTRPVFMHSSHHSCMHGAKRTCLARILTVAVLVLQAIGSGCATLESVVIVRYAEDLTVPYVMQNARKPGSSSFSSSGGGGHWLAAVACKGPSPLIDESRSRPSIIDRCVVSVS